VGEFSVLSDWEIHEICNARRNTITPLLPYLLSDEQVYSISGKLNRLKTLLIQLKQEGHRVLIFSQMTKMMNILESFFTREGHAYLRLDGSTPVQDRQGLIDKYNESPDNYFIFLLSTRAGGLGINLSTADTVIFYDIAFNPQVDRQAEDRCHRIGQKKDVRVITLLTRDSCEEQIWEMAHEKKELNDIMLQEGAYSKNIKDLEANENIEEKEEDLGSDKAMQIALNHIFGGDSSRDESTESPKRKRRKKDSKSKEPQESKKSTKKGAQKKTRKNSPKKTRKTREPQEEEISNHETEGSTASPSQPDPQVTLKQTGATKLVISKTNLRSTKQKKPTNQEAQKEAKEIKEPKKPKKGPKKKTKKKEDSEFSHEEYSISTSDEGDYGMQEEQ
jgi:superfamily II DNA/RNA helicase